MRNESLDLESTITQCRQGNPLAWESLVKCYQAKVYSVSFYYLRNTAEAQEASQEVFIKVFNALGRFAGEADGFLPWLLSITRNCCLDRIRRSKLRTKYEGEYEVAAVSAPRASESPEAITVREQRQRLMYQALSEFTETNRDILLLKDIQGLKLEQVAEILSLPVGTVKSRSSRARIDLAKRMAELMNVESGSSGVI